MSALTDERDILEQQLQRAREDNDADRVARANVQSPEYQEAVSDLERDAPPGEGAFVQNYAKLKNDGAPPRSERSEELLAEHAGANPVGRVIVPKVMITPRPTDDAHVTAPSARRLRELGLAEKALPAGRAIGGQTLKLAGAQAPDAAAAAVLDVPAPKRRSRLPWLLGLLALLTGAVLLFRVLSSPGAHDTILEQKPVTTGEGSTLPTAEAHLSVGAASTGATLATADRAPPIAIPTIPSERATPTTPRTSTTDSASAPNRPSSTVEPAPAPSSTAPATSLSAAPIAPTAKPSSFIPWY